jgi:hypothetical protein
MTLTVPPIYAQAAMAVAHQEAPPMSTLIAAIERDAADHDLHDVLVKHLTLPSLAAWVARETAVLHQTPWPALAAELASLPPDVATTAANHAREVAADIAHFMRPSTP